MSIRQYIYLSLRVITYMLVVIGVLAASSVALVYWHFMPQLPSIDTLKEVKFQVPLRIYSQDNALIAEFGEQRRIPLGAKDMPSLLLKAVLAAEDDRFYEHNGVDVKSLMRAGVSLLRTGEKRQGASTITMQVARNFFLDPEKTFKRKIIEMLLALKIENELSKEEILQLYLNQIFFGHRAYGVGAAAQVYYVKAIQELSLAEYATVAGLPAIVTATGLTVGESVVSDAAAPVAIAGSTWPSPVQKIATTSPTATGVRESARTFVTAQTLA